MPGRGGEMSEQKRGQTGIGVLVLSLCLARLPVGVQMLSMLWVALFWTLGIAFALERCIVSFGVHVVSKELFTSCWAIQCKPIF